MKATPFLPSDFHDARRSNRANDLLSTMISSGSAVINRNFRNFAAKTAAYRMINNDNITCEAIIKAYQRACQEAASSVVCNHVLCLQDTCEINYEAHSVRMHKKGRKPGIVSNKEAGCFVHPTLAINAETLLPLGFTSIKVWNRDEDAPTCRDRNYRKQPIEEKESYRWCDAIDLADSLLKDVPMKTVVSDRESDVYELFTHLYDETKWLIRSNRNRCISANTEKLHEKMRSMDSLGTYLLEISASHGRKARTAQMEVRFAAVDIDRPLNRSREEVASVRANCIRVSEVPGTTPKGTTPVEWILLTNHEVATVEDALRCVNWYKCRWYIEELFRLLKRKGFRIEDIELEDTECIEKDILLAMYAALRTIEIKHAFNNPKHFTKVPATHCFTASEVSAMHVILPTMEGRTAKQRCPYPKGSLPWMAWGLAKLGGWDCYSYKPGYTTFKAGLDQFGPMCSMYMAMKDVYNG